MALGYTPEELELYRYLIDDFLIEYCRNLQPKDFIVKTENLSRTKKGKRKYLNNIKTRELMRHWKATTEYHKTKDILHVKEMLGHRRISSTLIYTHLIHFENTDYHVKTAKTLKEACELAKCGFSYFTTMEGIQIFTKPK